MASGSVRVRFRVSPGARETRIVGRHGEAWKVRVAAPPERGRANEELLRHLAEHLGLPRDSLALVGGSTTRDKTVEVTGIQPAEAEQRLAEAAA